MKFPANRAHGFNLIELTVVILVIATLAALLVPAASRTLDRAKSAQAKNDVTQIVTAVNAYYTEYGKYPIATQGSDATYTTNNSDVIYTVRAIASGANASDALNPRKIVFLSPRQVSDTTARGGVTTTSGIYYDPWGQKTGLPEAGVYHIRIDGDYNNSVANPYGGSGGAGPDPVNQGVVAWSLGKDGKLGKAGNSIYTGSDDVISWQ